MAKTKEKEQKGEVNMKVYDDCSVDFVIDGDDKWIAAGFASGLEDARFIKIMSVAIETVMHLRHLQEKKEAKKKAATSKKKATDKKK